jgi:hypothetical protein
MMKNIRFTSPAVLIIGDAISILLVILLGFSTHQSDVATRLQFTLIPFLGAWLVAAAASGLYGAYAARWNQLWRVPLAMLFAAPLGAALRAAWLGTAVIPIFVLVMAATLTAALLLWRGIAILFSSRPVKA